jgi:hypothetical protein
LRALHAKLAALRARRDALRERAEAGLQQTVRLCAPRVPRSRSCKLLTGACPLDAGGRSDAAQRAPHARGARAARSRTARSNRTAAGERCALGELRPRCGLSLTHADSARAL